MGSLSRTSLLVLLLLHTTIMEIETGIGRGLFGKVWKHMSQLLTISWEGRKCASLNL